ncbi:hypothetical protein [Gracilinema caldarium]|uniref:Lipoprotein n=1 Tax=Gracilinema caldarium (strain ATCC 51460 / DSM 7334 / H1) TaxID=744872 RepID=F8F2Y1_GRAC1|nr:hypothetical protein [Gracilinema caldarium]AEJ19889.1 hypothetical protein Spica_1747 [Gracilinema caldarium DSM 7334]
MWKKFLGLSFLLGTFFLVGCVSFEPPKVSPLVYKEISFSELEQSIKQVNSPGNGFIVEGYDFYWDGSFRFSGSPGGTPSQWFAVHDGDYDDTHYYSYSVPNQFENYSSKTIKRIEKNKAYRVYIGLYQHSYYKTWTAFIDKIEGLMTEEEAIAYEQKQKAEKEASDAKAKAERDAAKDAIASSIAKGYIYHGVAEDTQSGKLFNSGALEPGHAYYISGFMVGGGGLTGGVITSLFVDPTYHVIEYASQAVKGEVVGASQTAFGTLPVAIVVVGGKAPLHIPLVIGLVK